MSDVNTLNDAKAKATVVWLDFLQYYKPQDPTQYCGFVEGKDDHIFYKQAVRSVCGSAQNIEFFVTKGKKNIQQYFFPWINNKQEINKQQILFFIDRDLSDFVEEFNPPDGFNIYVTDQYSIENDIVCSQVFKDLIEELIYPEIPKENRDRLVKQFNIEKSRFIDQMTPIMAHIIVWQKKSLKPANYSNISIDNLLQIQNGQVKFTYQDDKLIGQAYKQSQVDPRLDSYNTEAESIVTEIREKKQGEKTIRGKYLFSFFRLFCKNIIDHPAAFNLNQFNPEVQLVEKNLMQHSILRCHIADSLKAFLIKHISTRLKHIES